MIRCRAQHWLPGDIRPLRCDLEQGHVDGEHRAALADVPGQREGVVIFWASGGPSRATGWMAKAPPSGPGPVASRIVLPHYEGVTA